MDRFSALKAFTRVVEAGSFTRAADSLNMPNATLSKTIQQLEAHLGVSLLQRTTRRITVTPEGREYYEKARCLLEDLEEIDAAFNTARNKPKGHLRIAIGGSTGARCADPAAGGLYDHLAGYPYRFASGR
ncbi:LysR family transcriptional regulator [Klebsiella pneumoniae]|nr:LysR family transcriptional regulator [Klebsiella pneumoniae]